MSDNVNKPAHYNAGSVETIDGIRAALGEGFADYCKGNVLKYVWRCGKKGDAIEDLRKAAKYLQWAIGAMEINHPVMPDSSSRELLAIPAGWRELEPDEVPKATDMHEWMGGWFYRSTDATHEYKWHDIRHIRKIKPSNPSETPNSSLPDPLNCIGNICDLAESTGVTCPVDSCDLDTGVREAPAEPQPSNPPETPNSSKPDPIPMPHGWRELEPDEFPRVTDMYENEGAWRNRINDSSIEYARYDVRQIRKIETANPSETPNSSTATEWIPKVGDKVRVVGNHPRLCGEIAVVSEVYEPPLVSVVSDHDSDIGWLRFEEIQLIEATP